MTYRESFGLTGDEFREIRFIREAFPDGLPGENERGPSRVGGYRGDTGFSTDGVKRAVAFERAAGRFPRDRIYYALVETDDGRWFFLDSGVGDEEGGFGEYREQAFVSDRYEEVYGAMRNLYGPFTLAGAPATRDEL